VRSSAAWCGRWAPARSSHAGCCAGEAPCSTGSLHGGIADHGELGGVSGGGEDGQTVPENIVDALGAVLHINAAADGVGHFTNEEIKDFSVDELVDAGLDPGGATVTIHGGVLGGRTEGTTHPLSRGIPVSGPQDGANGPPEVGETGLTASRVLNTGTQTGHKHVNLAVHALLGGETSLDDIDHRRAVCTGVGGHQGDEEGEDEELHGEDWVKVVEVRVGG